MVITTSFAAADDVLSRTLHGVDTEVLSGSEFADDARGDQFLRRNRAAHQPGYDDAAYRAALVRFLERPEAWPPLATSPSLHLPPPALAAERAPRPQLGRRGGAEHAG